MKKYLTLLSSILLIVSFSNSAQAIPYSETQSQDVWFNTASSYTWHFDLDNDILDIGNINPEDTITSANIYFSVWDFDCAPEYVSMTFDNLYAGRYEVDSAIYTNAWNWVLGLVAMDHQLDVTFSNVNGDFMVSWFNISGTYIDNAAAAPVPEPATMLLLGTGLIGLAGLGRKTIVK